MNTLWNTVEDTRTVTKQEFYGLTWQFPQLWWILIFQGLNWKQSRKSRNQGTNSNHVGIPQELTGRFQRTPEQRRRPLGSELGQLACHVGPASLGGAHQSSIFAWWPPTNLYDASWPLFQVSLIQGLRFIPPRYISRGRPPPEAYLDTSIHYLQSSSGEGSLEWITSLEPSNQEED
jgi:hypothetical protein